MWHKTSWVNKVKYLFINLPTLEHCLPSNNYFDSNFFNKIVDQEIVLEFPISTKEQDSHNKQSRQFKDSKRLIRLITIKMSNSIKSWFTHLFLTVFRGKALLIQITIQDGHVHKSTNQPTQLKQYLGTFKQVRHEGINGVGLLMHEGY